MSPVCVRVSTVQMRSSESLDQNVSKITQFLVDLAADGVQIAVFPECALTSYDGAVIRQTGSAELSAALEAVSAACRANRVAALIGTPLFREDGKFWNSAVVFDSDGDIVERYHKVHLAEEWPEPGDHLALFDIAGVKATIIICHDGRYPELVRLPVIAGARLLFQLSCGSGLREEYKLDPGRAQIQARAVENGIWVVQANAPANEDCSGSHGESRIIAPDGNVLMEASWFKEEALTTDLDMTRADGLWARNSLNCEFLKEFWETGLKTLEKK